MSKKIHNRSLDKGSSGAGIQVISRAVEILRVLKKDCEGLSLGQIAGNVGLPRSTVQRIVYSLISEGMVMTTSAEGGLRLGPEIQSLASAGRLDIARIIRPVLETLAEETGETVDLSMFSTNHMVFVDQVVGTYRLRAVSAVGEIFPMCTTANGKAALARLDANLINGLVVDEIRHNSSVKKSKAEIMTEVEQIKRSDIAWDIDEHTDGISAVGTAFIGPNGLVYAISIPVPSQRFNDKKAELGAILKTALEKVRVLI